MDMGKPGRISAKALKEVEAALGDYISEVNLAPLAAETKITYTDHPSKFVRWLKYDFEPGV